MRTIARELGVAKSSVSLWVRDVPMAVRPSTATMSPSRVAADEPDRRCSRCGASQPAGNFNRAGESRQWWCRGCFRAYYEERKDHHKQRSNALKAQRKAANLEFLLDHLRVHPCVDCGEPDPVLLEFDHVGRKVREITVLAARGVRRKRLQLEMAECEIVCANCHRRRTAHRAGWRRTDPAAATFASSRQGRNVRLAWARLQHSGCADCGTGDLCVLDFDHVGVKTSNVMRLAWSEASVARLTREMDECVVRCANCHRQRTSVAGRHFRSRVP